MEYASSNYFLVKMKTSLFTTFEKLLSFSNAGVIFKDVQTVTRYANSLGIQICVEDANEIVSAYIRYEDRNDYDVDLSTPEVLMMAEMELDAYEARKG